MKKALTIGLAALFAVSVAACLGGEKKQVEKTKVESLPPAINPMPVVVPK